jgi:hypothetical protein
MVSVNRAVLTEKILVGERISAEDALELYRWPLEELGALANARRDLAKAKSYRGRGCEIVTYIVDRNINYTATFTANSAPSIERRKTRITTFSRSNRSTKNSTNFPPLAGFKS